MYIDGTSEICTVDYLANPDKGRTLLLTMPFSLGIRGDACDCQGAQMPVHSTYKVVLPVCDSTQAEK